MLAHVRTFFAFGYDGMPVDVEVDISDGMPGMDIVGLPDAAVKESCDRVRAALKNAGFGFPSQRVLVNLAPADVRKEGPSFDLPIAIGVLVAQGRIPNEAVRDTVFFGELALDGSVRAVHGSLAIAIAAGERGHKRLVLPSGNAAECEYLQGMSLHPVGHLRQAVEHLGGKPIEALPVKAFEALEPPEPEVDFANIRGLHEAKRTLEIAAAGGHNLLMVGAPSGGKTTLAKALTGILPDLTLQEALEATRMRSIAGDSLPGEGLMIHRPFRDVNHTATRPSLVGGGNGAHVTPGEISKAHNGVLFLDELTEFQRTVLEAMRQPLEEGSVTITRTGGRMTFPSRTMLVCAMNPCPCGYYGSPVADRCRCSPESIKRYLSHVSGPLLDRIDIHIEVEAVPLENLIERGAPEEHSAAVRARVNRARAIQHARYAGTPYRNNAQIGGKRMQEEFFVLSPDVKRGLRDAQEVFAFTPRTITHIVKIARTIADLASAPDIQCEHINEAIQYRTMDRKYWG